MIEVWSLCAWAKGALGDDSLSHLNDPDWFADLVVFWLIQWGKPSAFALFTKISQELFVLDFVLETELFAHGFMFGEQELLSRNVFVSLLKSELESSEIEDGFSPLFLQSLQFCVTLLNLFSFFLVTFLISVIFFNKAIIIFDFQSQQTLFLSFKDFISLLVIEDLLISY